MKNFSEFMEAASYRDPPTFTYGNKEYQEKLEKDRAKAKREKNAQRDSESEERARERARKEKERGYTVDRSAPKMKTYEFPSKYPRTFRF